MAVYKATLLDEAAVGRVLRRISHEIVEKNGGCEDLCIIGIKRRGVPLAETIAANSEMIEGVKIPVGTLDITFYRDDLTEISPDPVLHAQNIPFDLTGKRVVLVDDVLYTGRTVRACRSSAAPPGFSSPCSSTAGTANCPSAAITSEKTYPPQRPSISRSSCRPMTPSRRWNSTGDPARAKVPRRRTDKY